MGWKHLGIAVTVVAAAGLVGCAPGTFVRGEAGREVIELREGLQADRAWHEMVDVVSANWDLEQLSKDAGYLRTGWRYGIAEADARRYRGRVALKYRPPERQVRLKTEAQWWDGGYWLPGYDTQLQRSVRAAIAERVGRANPR